MRADVPATGDDRFNVPGNWELRVITTEGADVQISEPYQFHVLRAGR